MAALKEIGTMQKKNCEQIKIEWRTVKFLSLAEDNDMSSLRSLIFSFEGGSVYLIFRSKSLTYPKYIFLNMYNKVSHEYSVECYRVQKRLHGTAEQLLTSFLNKNDTLSNNGEFVQLEQHKSEFLPLDVLTVICTSKYESVFGDNHIGIPTKLIKLNTLSEKYRCLFKNKIGSDVTLHVRDKDQKAVLIAHSAVLAAIFNREMSMKQTNVGNVITIPDSFKAFLEFLYCGQLEILPYSKAVCLYKTSNKYGIQKLMTFSIKCLIENLNEENLCDIVMLADKYDDKYLLSAAQKFFNMNASKIFPRPEWELLIKYDVDLGNNLLIEWAKNMK